MGPNEMIRLWNATELLHLFAVAGFWFLVAAISAIAQDDLVPTVERWIWRAAERRI